jgi:hypothetical protein
VSIITHKPTTYTARDKYSLGRRGAVTASRVKTGPASKRHLLAVDQKADDPSPPLGKPPLYEKNGAAVQSMWQKPRSAEGQKNWGRKMKKHCGAR